MWKFSHHIVSELQRVAQRRDSEACGLLTEFRTLQPHVDNVWWESRRVSWEVWNYSSYIRELWNSRSRLRLVMHPGADLGITDCSNYEWEYA